MIEDLLPPSPNWYCSQASDSSKDGLFAYAARNVIFILDVRKNQPRFVGSLTGHSNRVTAVRFGLANHNVHLCATAGDDGCVKLWDVRNKSVAAEHQFHNENKVTVLDWCVWANCANLIISGDEKGTLIWWNHVSGEKKEFSPERGHIFCLASCPHDEPYVAVGYKTGLVLIVDIDGKGQIIHKLRGHDEEIHSVCWSPAIGESICLRKPNADGSTATHSDGSPTDGVQATPPTSLSSFKEQGCLLITGSRDRTIRVWNASQGKAVLTLSLPPRGGGHRGTRERGDDGGKARVWLSLCWPSHKPREFMSSSYGGDIIRWDLCMPGKQKWEYCGVEDSASHNRIAFNITQTPLLSDMFITTSMDRQIICWNMKTLKAVWSLPTLGGFVYSLSACPVDPGCLALGVGDNMIRVWNTAAPKRDSTVTVLWQGIKSKVTALCWHPERDNCLAYGTDDGRTGIYNTFNQGKGPHLSSTFHKKTVYSLSWGPQCPSKEGGLSYCLYSCAGDGIIYQHDPSKLGEDATNFNSLIRSANQITYMFPLRTDVSWRHDSKAVAIGNEDGSIDVLAAPSLLLLCTIQVHHKLINCLKWYPRNSHSEASMQFSDQSAGALQKGLECPGQSLKRYWLASGSNEPQVQVHDLASVLGGSEPVQLKAPVTGSFRTLNGHTMRITALSWSPHGDGRLVSTSYDGTAEVWDVLNGEPVANFRGHHGRVFSVVWSDLDPDIIFTGGEDFCMMKWRVSNMQHTKPPSHKRSTFTAMQRGGKGKSSSSAKGNKKRTKPSKDVAHSRSMLPTAPAEGLLAQAPPIQERSAQETPPAGPVPDTPDDVTSLRRLLEEKKLEMEKVAVAGDDLTLGGGEGRDANDVDPTGEENVARESSSVGLHGADDGGDEATEVGMTSGAQETDHLDAAFKKDGRRKKKHRSLFPLSRCQDNRGKLYHLEDCITLAAHKYGSKEAERSTKLHPGEGDSVHLGLFADRRAAYAMFKEEGSHHDEVGYRDQNQHLEMWKGNLAGALTKATELSQLNSFLVAMAPLGGYDVWLETTAAYARQLERSQDYTQAATYYLACHKIHKALSVLTDNKLFREAVALASVRLSPYDPAFADVYKAWASHLESEGNYGQAAKCYLTINQPANAVMLLGRKSDIPSLAAALRVSCLADQGDLTRGLMVRYLHECLMAGDWLEAQGLLTNHISVLFGSLVAMLHEVIVTTLTHQEFIPGDLFLEPKASPWVQGMLSTSQTQTMDKISEWSALLVDQSPLLSHAVERWFRRHGMDPADEDNARQLYNAVASVQQQSSQQLSDRQLLIALAFELTLGQLSVQMGGASDEPVSHWLLAVAMCHDAGDMNLAKGILSVILPKGVQSLAQLQGFPKSPANSADVASLHAYYLFTLLYHLWWEVGNISSSNEEATFAEGSSSPTHPGTATEGDSNKGDKIASGTFDGGSLEVHSNHTGDTPSLVAPRKKSAAFKTNDPPTHFNNEVNDTLPQTKSEQDGASGLTDDEGAEGVCCDATRDDAGRLVGMRRLEETLCTKLKEISQSLLSEPHAQLRCLRGRLRHIQMAVGRLVAQHAREGQEGVAHLQQEESHRVVDNYGPEALESTSYAGKGNGSTATNDSPRENTGHLQEQSLPPQSPDQNRDDFKQPAGSGLEDADLASTDDVLETSVRINVPSSQQSQEHPDDVDARELSLTEREFDAGCNKTASLTVREEATSSEISLPSNWDDMMADVKYSHPAVTYAVLMEEQGRITQDLEMLSKEFEFANRPFPDTLEAALVISNLCHSASLKMNVPTADRTELRQLGKNAASWGLGRSWLAWQGKRFEKHHSDLQ